MPVAMEMVAHRAAGSSAAPPYVGLLRVKSAGAQSDEEVGAGFRGPAVNFSQ